MKYSGIGVFKHVFDDPNKITKFEERTVITEAPSYKDAENLILSEFKDYCGNGISFLDVYEINEVIESPEQPVTQVARSIKVFTGSDEEYLQKFWDDQQPLSCEDNGWRHVWFTRTDKTIACYNCQKEKTDDA